MILRFKKSITKNGYALQLEVDFTNKTYKKGYCVFNASAIELKAREFNKLLEELDTEKFKKL